MNDCIVVPFGAKYLNMKSGLLMCYQVGGETLGIIVDCSVSMLIQYACSLVLWTSSKYLFDILLETEL